MNIKRLLFVLTLSLVLLATTGIAGAGAFADIDDSDVAAAVETLYQLDIVDGYTDGNFYPEMYLTRAQFCKMVVLAMGRGAEVETYARATRFSDVPSSQWSAGYVNLATSLGVINGYGNGLFGPDDSVSYAQAATMLLRVLGYTTADIGYYWPGDYLAFAAKIGLDSDLGLAATDAVSRGDAAILITAMLSLDSSGGSAYSSGAYADSEKNVIILDHDAVSDEGYDSCLMVYVPGSTTATASGGTVSSSGRIDYYKQEEELDDGFIGCQGTLFLNEEGEAAGFAAGGREYAIEYAVLLDNNAGSAGNGSRLASFYIDGGLEEYPQVSILSASLVGSYGLLLLNENGYVYAFEEYGGGGYTMAEDVLLLESTRSQAVVYNGGVIACYDASSRFSSSVGCFGALLLDGGGEAAGFLEDDDVAQDSVTITGADSGRLYTLNGDMAMADSVAVIYPESGGGWSLERWADIYQDIAGTGRLSATIYYDQSGETELLLLADACEV